MKYFHPLSEDKKNGWKMDSRIYNLCVEYIKLYHTYQGLKEYDVGTIGVEEKSRFLLLDLQESIFTVLNLNYDIITYPDMDGGADRFNYNYSLNNYAEFTDNLDETFNIRVLLDDADSLDELLNGLHNMSEDLKAANHNLTRVINSYNRLLNESIESCTDTDLQDYLIALRKKLI